MLVVNFVNDVSNVNTYTRTLPLMLSFVGAIIVYVLMHIEWYLFTSKIKLTDPTAGSMLLHHVVCLSKAEMQL